MNMVKISPIILSLFVVSCMADSKRQEYNVVYNETALKEFVIATTGRDGAQSLESLDSVLTDALQDSAVFFETVSFLENPFGNPNSAFKNDDLFAALLQAKMKSSWTD